MKPTYHPRTILFSTLVGINILVLTLSGYALFKSQQHYESRAQALTQNIASAVDQNVSSSIGKIDVALRAVVDKVEFNEAHGIDRLAINEFLTRYVQYIPEIEAIRVSDQNGIVMRGNGVASVVNLSDRDHFIYHRDNNNGHLQVSKPLWGRVTNHYILVFSHRYNHPDGRFGGMVYATVSLDHFNKILSRFDLGPDDALIIRDSDFGLVARYPDISNKPAGMVGNSAVSKELRHLLESGVRLATYHTPTSADGLERTFSFRRLDSGPFIVLAGLATRHYMVGWNNEVHVILAMNIGFLLLTVLSGRFLLKSFSAVQTSSDLLKEAQHIAHVGSWTMNRVTGKLLLSDEVFRMFEISPGQFNGTYESFFNFFHPEDRDAVNRCFAESLAKQTSCEMEHRLLMADGRIKWVQHRSTSSFDLEGKPLRSQGALLDITERKQSEDALHREKEEQRLLIKKLEEAQNYLLQSEKMASIGLLAAGVAHEINNPIGYVHSNLGTLDQYVHDIFDMLDLYQHAEDSIADPELREQLNATKKKVDIVFLREDLYSLLNESKEGITRVKQIVQNLKDFAHMDIGEEWHFSDLHKGLDSTLNIVNNEIKYKADVIKEYGAIPEVECLSSQINQVFMNLLVNAAHAIEQRGTITISTGKQGDKVWVSIADTGQGIAPDHLSKIFDPFFTTKPVGKGTGLGLSLSYSIIHKHQGRIEVQSEVGKGTTFRVWLPVRQSRDKLEP